jgi:hypothetical protein
MIKLKQLIVEHPDLIVYNKKGYTYQNPQVHGVFSVFQDSKTKRWICSVLIDEPSRMRVTTDDEELNRLIKEEDLEIVPDTEYAIHPELLQTFINLHRLPSIENYMEYRNNRLDIPVNGRVWDATDGKTGLTTTLVSLWSKFGTQKPYQEKLDQCLRLMKRDPKSCLYEFVDRQFEWLSYDDVINPKAETKPLSASEEQLVKKLLRIQHTSPEAKKLINIIHKAPPDKLQSLADKTGTTVAALKHLASMDERKMLKEDPDGISINQGRGREPVYLIHDDGSAVAVAGVGQFYLPGKNHTKSPGWYAYLVGQEEYYTNGEMIHRLNGECSQTHGDVVDKIFGDYYEADEYGDYYREVHFRIYEYKGVFYSAFWETSEKCKKWKKEIQACLDFVTGGKSNKVMIQFGEQADDKFTPFPQAFRTKTKRQKTDVEMRLRQKLHQMAPAQKAAALKKLGAVQPDKLKQAADKLGITAIELRQQLGLDVAENSLGNLSFSDYHDPSIPYEAKPRTSFGFSYGTVFERFSRKHKKKL